VQICVHTYRRWKSGKVQENLCKKADVSTVWAMLESDENVL